MNDERTPLLLEVRRRESDGRAAQGRTPTSPTAAMYSPSARPGERRSSHQRLPPQAGDVLVQSIHGFMAMCVFPSNSPVPTHTHTRRELHLQRQLIKLQELLEVTQHEPRLKGPFPVGLYRDILASLQRVLDKLHSMRCVTTREEW